MRRVVCENPSHPTGWRPAALGENWLVIADGNQRMVAEISPPLRRPERRHAGG